MLKSVPRSHLPRVAQLALRHGGLGLCSAALHAPAAFWASWADAFTVLSVRDAPFLQGLAQAFDARNLSAGTPIRDLLAATDVLVAAGFRMLLWADLPQHAPAQPADDAEPEVALRGWQRPASRALDDDALAEHRHSVGTAELALLDSQSGPFATRVLTVRPTAPELAVDSAPFRASDFLCRWPQPAAAANARWMCWVIMSQPSPGPAPYDSAAGRLNEPPHVSVAKPAQLSLQMCWSATSTSKLQGRMSGHC